LKNLCAGSSRKWPSSRRWVIDGDPDLAAVSRQRPGLLGLATGFVAALYNRARLGAFFGLQQWTGIPVEAKAAAIGRSSD
jgi:hypothetical protein